MIKYDDLIWIDPQEVKVINRIRTNVGDIEDLARRIKTLGLRHPITINKDKQLLAGQRRLEALLKLGEKKIPAFVNDIADPIDLELDENIGRKQFVPSEAVIAAERLLERIGSRQGRRLDLATVQEEELMDGDTQVKKGTKTRDYIAREVGFGHITLQNAKKVVELVRTNKAKNEVLEAMDAGAISVNCAYSIVENVKKANQISALNEAINDPLSYKEKLKGMNDKRRNTKRKKRFHVPDSPDAHPIYNIIRVAPDWYNELEEDINSLPVSDYAINTGVVAVECPNEKLAAAVRAIEAWGFTYSVTITCYSTRKQPEGSGHLHFIDQRSWHIVIGQIDAECYGARTTKIPPVFNKQDQKAGLLEILGEIWKDKQDSRLDMSATEPRAGWKIWKLDYAKKDDV